MPDATVRFANLRAGQFDMIERIEGYVPYPDGLIRLRDVKYSNGRI